MIIIGNFLNIEYKEAKKKNHSIFYWPVITTFNILAHIQHDNFFLCMYAHSLFLKTIWDTHLY